MFQKDYILRMMEMLSELIAGILGMIKKGDYRQAEESLNETYYNLLKEDASVFRSIPKERLTRELLEQHNYTNDHLQVLAELFFAEAGLQCAKDNEEGGKEYYEKSLLLFEFIENNSNSYSMERQSKISLIKKKLYQGDE